MSDLLRIASADLAGARYYASNETDDVYLNLAGYHCAQAEWLHGFSDKPRLADAKCTVDIAV